MCTVSFIPVKDELYITSNRDEKHNRKQAFPPAVYSIAGGRIIYPKDADANGSWIALHENGNAAVLLNGAFVKHAPQPPYRESRGIILLDIISAATPAWHFHKYDLRGTEPFTIILLDNNNLYECRWDAIKKHCRQLKTYRPYIWSSVTLYDDAIVKRREQWLAAFLNKNSAPTREDIVQFHQFTGNDDLHNGLKINRDGLMSTVSITSIKMNKYSGSILYTDLKDNKKYIQGIVFTSLLTEA